MLLGQQEGQAGRRSAAEGQADAEDLLQEGVVEGLRRRALRDDAAAIHHHEMVGIGHGEVEIVQHDQHRDASPRDAAGHVEQRELMAEVEARDRLVEEQDLPLRDAAPGFELTEHAGELDALLFAAGERLVAPAGEIEHPGCGEGLRHDGLAPLARQRAADAVDAEITQAWRRLRDLLGETLLPIFVPPWNRIDPRHAARLPALGFAGLSCFRDHRNGPGGGPALLNTHVDVMDWHGGRVGRSAAALVGEIATLLAGWREDEPGADALGLLLHHRDHDETAWSVLDDLLTIVADHPAAAVADPRSLLYPDGLA